MGSGGRGSLGWAGGMTLSFPESRGRGRDQGWWMEEVRGVKGQEPSTVYTCRKGVFGGRMAQIWARQCVWVDAVEVTVLGAEEI